MSRFTVINEHDPELISYLDELPFWSAPFALKIFEKVIPARHLTVVDIGFGTGVPLIELASRLGNTCKVYGIDPWKEACERVKEKISIFGIRNIEIFNQPAELIPLADHSVDLIVSNNGLNNVEDPGQVLTECNRVLKPGGKIIFTMNTEDTMIEFYSIMESVLADQHLAEIIPEMKNHIHRKRKPVTEIHYLLSESGFSDLSTDHHVFNYTFADGTALFGHFFIRLAFLGPWLELVPEGKQNTIFSEIEQRINAISEEKGHFSLQVPFVVIEAYKREQLAFRFVK